MKFLALYLYGWLWYLLLIRGPERLFFWTHQHTRRLHDHGLSWLGFYAYTPDDERPLRAFLSFLRAYATFLLLLVVALGIMLLPLLPFVVWVMKGKG